MREIGDARGDGVLREQEFGMPHGRWPREPRIDENGESPWRIAIAMRRRSLFGRGEGQEEGRVTIQVLDFERHDVASAAGFCVVSIRFR